MRNLIVIALLFCLQASAQTHIVINHTLIPPKLELRCTLGCRGYPDRDTTYWRMPKDINQSVLMFSYTVLSQEQKDLREYLLGFFYNPMILQYNNGQFSVNQKKSLYKKNNIPLAYRGFVTKFYKDLNEDLQEKFRDKIFDEQEFKEEFLAVQKQYSREIKK